MRAVWLEIAACLLSCALGAAGGEAAADWPHAFGPNYDRHVDATNLTRPWTGGRPALLWQTSIGEGYSGMSVVEGRVYTQSQGRDGQYVDCLDMETGRVLWRTRYNYPWQHAAEYPGPYATPTYQGGRIYFADCYGFAGCLDARNGKPLWKLNLTEHFAGKGTGFGYACSPLVEDGRVFLPVGGQGAAVVAVSANDAGLNWQAGNDEASYVPSVPITVQGHRQIVSLLQNVLVAQDPATGRELWRERLSEDGYDEHSTIPLYQEPLLFCSSPFRRGSRVLRLSYEDGMPKADLFWKNRSLSCDVFSAVLVDGCVYGSDVQQPQANPRGGTRSQFKCVELATGREFWSSSEPGHASVLACGDKLLLLNEAGFLIVVEASPTGYHELTRTRVVERAAPCWTSPTIYRGRLLVRNHEMLACYQIGPTPIGTATLAGGNVDPRNQPKPILNLFLAWLDIHQGSAAWDPSLNELALWYTVGVGLLTIAAIGAWFLRNQMAFLPTFLSLSAVLGILVFPLASYLAGRLVFTWPVACHSIVLGLLAVGGQAGPTARIKSRMALFLVVPLCAGYYEICQEIFLPSGIGFLCGFGMALPVVLWIRRSTRPAGPLAIALVMLSFSLYFWSSSLVILWRMHR